MRPAPQTVGSARLVDLLAIPEETRFHEVVDGELIRRAEPSFDHGEAQIKMAAVLDPYHRRPGAGGPGGWWFASETEIELEPAQIVRPDLAGWRRDVAPERPGGVPVRLRPQWICEILSQSNVRMDTVKKLRVYHQCRIEHYWI